MTTEQFNAVMKVLTDIKEIQRIKVEFETGSKITLNTPKEVSHDATKSKKKKK